MGDESGGTASGRQGNEPDTPAPTAAGAPDTDAVDTGTVKTGTVDTAGPPGPRVPGTGWRVFLSYLALNLAAAGLLVTGHFGAQLLGSVGLFGTQGVLAVERCGTTPKSTSADPHTGSGGGEHYCFGTFRPDGGGPVVESVRLRGGSGDDHAPPPPGSRCARTGPDRPSWCGPATADAQDVRARLVGGEAWIFGNGAALPFFAAVAGLATTGAGLLGLARSGVWPDPGRRPRWLDRVPVVLVTAGVVGTVGAFLALALVNV